MAVPTAVPLRRLSVEDVLAMAAAGILREDDRVELIDGVLVEMNPIGPQHSKVVARLNAHFTPAVAGRYEARVQDQLTTGERTYVLPDLIVMEPVGRDEFARTALLVVEVAQTSHARDAEKVQTYAEAGVQEYWIVDVLAEAVRVYRWPQGSSYRSVQDHTTGAVATMLEGVPPVELAALFGR